MFQAIIFDMDGLMVDTEKIYMEHFSKQLKTIGIDLSIPVFRGQMGMTPDDEALYMIEQYQLDMTIDDMKSILKMDGIQNDIIQGTIKLEPMPGLFNLIRNFSHKLKYGVASGSSLKMISYTINKLQLKTYIPVLTSAEEVKNGKPSPDIYLETAKRLNLDIKQCIVLEDAPKGVLAGKDAGAYVIAVPNEWTDGYDFSNADQICNSLDDAVIKINNLL